MNVSRFSFRSMVAALALLPLAANALGLGEVIGQAVMGQPLAVRIALTGDDAATLAAHCVSLHPSLSNPGEESRLTGAAVTLLARGAAPVLLISTRSPVTQPVLSFSIRIDCGPRLMRDYQLLPAPPAPVIATEPPVLRAERAEPLDAPPGNIVTITAETTLRLMSRKRYPQDSKARVAFIRRVVAVNRDIFPAGDAAFDQRLAAGTQLRLPDGLPVARTTEELAREVRIARPAASASVELPVQRGGKGRLVIGGGGTAAGMPQQSAAETNELVNRLMDMMQDQVLVQTALVERLKIVEKEVAEAKLAAVAQRSTNQHLETELQRLRDDSSRNSTIQLVLAILLGGFAGGAFLRWREQRSQPREPIAEISFGHVTAIKPNIAPSVAPPITQKYQMQSVFDDLLPPR